MENMGLAPLDDPNPWVVSRISEQSVKVKRGSGKLKGSKHAELEAAPNGKPSSKASHVAVPFVSSKEPPTVGLPSIPPHSTGPVNYDDDSSRDYV